MHRPREAPIVVLGCRPIVSEGRLVGALGRRVAAAASLWTNGRLVVASGGRAWDGVVEATAMAGELARLGVDPSVVVRELSSFSTRENALFTARWLRARGMGEITLVTSEDHLPRATRRFEDAGLRVVDALGAASRGPRVGRPLWPRVTRRFGVR